jgi:hypothetical protein
MVPYLQLEYAKTYPTGKRRNSYCNVLGLLGPFTSRVYVTYHFWTPICNVLGYWRHRSVCYTSLFTTSLVVTTFSVYNVLGPSDIVSRSGPGSSALVLGSPWIFSDRCWSLFCDLFCDLSSVSSLLCDLSSVLSLALCVPVRLSAAPEVGCWCPGEKTPCRRVSFPVLALLRISTIRLPRNSQPLSSNAHIWCSVYFGSGSRCIGNTIYVTIYMQTQTYIKLNRLYTKSATTWQHNYI